MLRFSGWVYSDQLLVFCSVSAATSSWWTVKHQVPPGHVQDVEVRSQTAFCSSPWNDTGTHAASSAPAAKPSWETLAPPATAKGAWFFVAATISGEKQHGCGVRREEGKASAGLGFLWLHSQICVVVSLLVFLQTVWTQWGMQLLWAVDPSQRNGDEGTGKCLPPQGKSPANIVFWLQLFILQPSVIW